MRSTRVVVEVPRHQDGDGLQLFGLGHARSTGLPVDWRTCSSGLISSCEGRTVCAVELVEQRARGAAADLALAVPDGGQRRRGDRRFFQIVIAGDRDVDTGHQAGARDAVHQADGDEVVPAAGGRRLVLQRQELPGGLEAGLLGARAGQCARTA